MSAMPTAVQIGGAVLVLVGLFSKLMELRDKPGADFLSGFFSGLNYTALVAGLCLLLLGLVYQFFFFHENDAGNKPSDPSSHS